MNLKSPPPRHLRLNAPIHPFFALHQSRRALHTGSRASYAQVRALHARVRALHMEVRVLHAEVRTLHAEVRALHAEVHALHSEVHALHSEVRALHARVCALHAEDEMRHFGQIGPFTAESRRSAEHGGYHLKNSVTSFFLLGLRGQFCAPASGSRML